MYQNLIVPEDSISYGHFSRLVVTHKTTRKQHIYLMARVQVQNLRRSCRRRVWGRTTLDPGLKRGAGAGRRIILPCQKAPSVSCHGLPIYSAIPIGRFGNGRLNSAQSGCLHTDAHGPRGLQPGIHHPLHHLVHPGRSRASASGGGPAYEPWRPSRCSSCRRSHPHGGDLARQPAHHPSASP